MKKIKLFTIALLLGICMTMPMFLVGCTDFTSVHIYIKEEYNDKFDAREFMLEDFNLENVKYFEYRRFFSHWEFNDDLGDYVLDENGHRIPVYEGDRFLMVKLVVPDKNALEHFSELEFAEIVTFYGSGLSPGHRVD